MRMPDEAALKAIEAMQNPPKRKRGRPKGSKNKPGVTKAATTLIDPKTGIAVRNTAMQSQVIGKMGDERVTAFVQYHVDMLKMRKQTEFIDEEMPEKTQLLKKRIPVGIGNGIVQQRVAFRQKEGIGLFLDGFNMLL